MRSISFATYAKVTKPVEDDKLEYESDGMLKSEYRDMFLTKNPFQVANGEVLVEDSDLVLMGDGTWKRADELKEKDVVMSLNVPTSGGVDIRKHTADYNISFDELQEGSGYTTASVASMNKVNGYVDKVSIEFEDGTDWFDTSYSSNTATAKGGAINNAGTTNSSVIPYSSLTLAISSSLSFATGDTPFIMVVIIDFGIPLPRRFSSAAGPTAIILSEYFLRESSNLQTI